MKYGIELMGCVNTLYIYVCLTRKSQLLEIAEEWKSLFESNYLRTLNSELYFDQNLHLEYTFITNVMLTISSHILSKHNLDVTF